MIYTTSIYTHSFEVSHTYVYLWLTQYAVTPDNKTQSLTAMPDMRLVGNIREIIFLQCFNWR